MTLKPHQSAMIAGAAAATLLEIVPIFKFLALPLQFLNASLHETCHAVMGLATGAQVGPIELFPDGSGVTNVIGGSTFLTASAGYLGASAIGAATIYAARTERGARLTLQVIAAALVASLALWVRGMPVGVGACMAWVAVCFLSAHYIRGKALVTFAQFLGVLQCVSSMQSLFVVLQISAFTARHSDAKIMEETTRIPAIAWSLLWFGLSIGAMLLSARAAWRRPTAEPRTRSAPI